MIGLLAFPWIAAAVYAGWEASLPLAGVLVIVGSALGTMHRQATLVTIFERSPSAIKSLGAALYLIVGLLLTFGLVVAVLYGVGMGLRAILG